MVSLRSIPTNEFVSFSHKSVSSAVTVDFFLQRVESFVTFLTKINNSDIQYHKIKFGKLVDSTFLKNL